MQIGDYVKRMKEINLDIEYHFSQLENHARHKSFEMCNKELNIIKQMKLELLDIEKMEVKENE